MNSIDSLRVYLAGSPAIYFILLTFAHFIGDWLFQTDYEALNKAKGPCINKALVTHCLKYTAFFIPVIWLCKQDFAWLLLILGSHLVIDRRFLIVNWRKVFQGGTEDSIQGTFWLSIVVDQVFHFAILIILLFGSLIKITMVTT